MENVGVVVKIPADAWDPPAESSTKGCIFKFHAPTKTYPLGRYEVSIQGDKSKYMWPVDRFPQEWLTDEREVVPTTPRVGRTPSRTSRPSAQISSPGAHGRRSRSAALTPPSSENTPDEMAVASVKAEVVEDQPPPAQTPAAAPSAPRSSSPSPDPIKTPQDPKPLMQTKTGDNITLVPRISSRQNRVNAAVALSALALPLLCGYLLRSTALTLPPLSTAPSLLKGIPSVHDLADIHWWCALYLHEPFIIVNVLFFVFVDVMMWLIALIQGSTWLIDPAWTIIPPVIDLLYLTHPFARGLKLRRCIASGLLYVWSARLTYSYFRREEWQWGAREDWRFTDLSKKFGRHWWWLCFFATYVSQQLMLVGITWPMHAIHTSDLPLSGLDWLATAGAVAGIFIACVADNQLRAFMKENERRRDAGLKPILLLNTGLWRYSRHPNHFGEQLWWWSLWLFAVRLGKPYMVAGTAFNSACLVAVMRMVEDRMVARGARREVYREYQRTTPMCVPWPWTWGRKRGDIGAAAATAAAAAIKSAENEGQDKECKKEA